LRGWSNPGERPFCGVFAVLTQWIRRGEDLHSTTVFRGCRVVMQLFARRDFGVNSRQCREIYGRGRRLDRIRDEESIDSSFRNIIYLLFVCFFRLRVQVLRAT
jgi:hypothetical protein